MTEPQYKALTSRVAALLGIHMTWEGPEPHDFRNMKERGVRFVHSDLYARLPEHVAFDGEITCRPDLLDIAPASDRVEFKVAVGDDAARGDVERRICAVGFAVVYEPTYGPVAGHVRFTVPLSWLAEEQNGKQSTN